VLVLRYVLIAGCICALLLLLLLLLRKLAPQPAQHWPLTFLAACAAKEAERS
jgi:hypothetical protein